MDVCALKLPHRIFIISLVHLILYLGKLIEIFTCLRYFRFRHSKYQIYLKKGLVWYLLCCKLFVVFKPPDRPQWDKDSRIVKDYVGLLLHCIS